MGIGAITLDAAGSVTEPTRFPLDLPSAESMKGIGYGLYSSIGIPRGRGLLFANGMDPLRKAIDDTPLRCGLLAPPDALAVSSGGDQATATLDLDDAGNGASIYHPAANDVLWLGNLASSQIVFVANLSDTPSTTMTLTNYLKVLRGASGADALDNLQDVINGVNKGVTWDEPNGFTDHATSLRSVIEVSSHPTTYQVVFRALDAGTSGNALWAGLAEGSWTDCDFGSGGSTVSTTYGYFEGGTDGSGSAPEAGSYYYGWGYSRKIDGARSGIADLAQANQGTAQNVDLTSITDSVFDSVNAESDYKFWTRTQSDGRRHFIGEEILDSGSTDTDDLSNETLGKRLAYEAAYHRAYADGFIHRVRFLAKYKGRWFGAGVIRAATYDQGTVSVTNGSRRVDFSSTAYVTQEMEHREFATNASIEDDADKYTIIHVDEANRYAYLDREFEGTTNGTRAYEIRDVRDPFRIHYCEIGLPDQVGGAYFIDQVLSPDPEGITGLYEAFGALIIFTRTGVWSLVGTGPTSFRLTNEYEGVGCAGGQSVIYIDGVLYWLGTDGAIYGWGGSGEPLKVSSPPSQSGEVSGIKGTTDRINMRFAHNVVAHYHASTNAVRWFVPLDDDTTNRNVLVYGVQTGTWGLDTCEDITCVETVADPNGKLRTLAGDIHGQIFELDVEPVSGQGSSDGAYGFEPVFTVTSGDVESATGTGASFPTSGVGAAWLPVTHVDASGNLVRARVASNTSTKLNYTRFLDAAPAATTQGVVGAIVLDIETGRFTLADPAENKTLEAVRVTFAKDVDGQFFLGYAVNDGTPAIVSGEEGALTAADGEEHFWPSDEGRRLKLRILCLEPGCDPAFDNLQLWVIPTGRP